MAKVIVLEGQSLFDLSVQACGGIDAGFAIAELNGLSITDKLEIGSSLDVPDPVYKQISDYYKVYELKPATDLPPSTGSGSGEGGGIDELLDDGIDYMAIEVDNVVM